VAVATVAASNAARAIFIEFLPADMQGRLRVAHRPSHWAFSQMVEAGERQAFVKERLHYLLSPQHRICETP
jgi:hypothetical protein